jgi:polyisoprenoid-binding protein YceI
MKSSFLTQIGRRTALFFIAGLVFSAVAAQAAPETFKIDPAHSSVEFKIRHLGISWVTGVFKDFEGTVVYDEADPSKNSIEVTVKADSVDTSNSMRNDHLKKPEYFNVEKFPTLTFKSSKVEKTEKGEFKVTGDFTLLGVSKSIVVEVEGSGPVEGMKKEVRRGGETEFTIKRSDYGMKEGVGPVGDEVKITLAFSAIKQ